MTPSSVVWNRLEQSIILPEKSKKKYFYWITGSIAALFLLGFLLFKNTTTKLISKPETALNKNKINLKNSASKKNIIQSTNKEITVKSKEINKIPNTKVFTIINKVKASDVIVNTEEKLHQKDITAIKVNLSSTLSKTIISIKNTILEKQNLNDVVLKEHSNKKLLRVKNHWSVSPVISQFFYRSFSSKSTIDPGLNRAKKTGGNSTAYGFKIAYQATKKLRIQTGVHHINLSQTTQNIALVETRNNRMFTNSSPNVVNKNPINGTKNMSFFTKNNELYRNANTTSNLSQNFSYLEIPIEINYELFGNNRLQFHLIGGFSTLLLTENNIEIKTNNFKYFDGKATNLNNVNFSLNFGTDIEYHLSKKWFLNITPNLKIQTKTFSRNSNNPYLMGISSGINYKF